MIYTITIREDIPGKYRYKVTGEDGTDLILMGGIHSAPGAWEDVQLQIKDAVLDAAPEIGDNYIIEWEGN